jgi:hypothetical protein
MEVDEPQSYTSRGGEGGDERVSQLERENERLKEEVRERDGLIRSLGEFVSTREVRILWNYLGRCIRIAIGTAQNKSEKSGGSFDGASVNVNVIDYCTSESSE